MKHLPTKPASLLFAFLFLIPAAVMAQDSEINYTYIEADYINLDLDALGDSDNFVEDIDDGGGWGVLGSFAISDSWFVFGSYSETEADASFIDDNEMLIPADSDAKRFDVGIGFHAPLNEMADWVVRAAYTDTDIDDFDFGATEDEDLDDLFDDPSDGYFVDAAIRMQLMPALEGKFGARYTDIEDNDDISLLASALWEFTDNFALNLSGDFGDDVRLWRLGLRFGF
ncbi:MAG: outer membrane beta-barrel protein [Pseudohongiellaceae bacterium]